MSNLSLIVGESGTGKSTSIRTLDPKETFIINVANKALPFRGYKTFYKSINADCSEGNFYSSDNYQRIIKLVNVISNNRPEIKTIVIDDFQFIMANEFFRSADKKGYDKFTDIGQHAWMILNTLKDLREDIDVFVLTHAAADDSGKMNIKTIGKLLSEKYSPEAAATMMLQTEIENGNYYFITQGDARHIAKSPMDMFDSREIPNDLAFVKQKMHSYWNDGAIQ